MNDDTIDPEVLTRLRTAEADMVVCRAMLDVPEGVPLAEKVREIKAALEQAQKQFGNCSICGYAAWKCRDGDANVEECQYCKLSKAAAEMRASDAGRDYKHRDEYKPLLTEAVNGYRKALYELGLSTAPADLLIHQAKTNGIYDESDRI